MVRKYLSCFLFLWMALSSPLLTNVAWPDDEDFHIVLDDKINKMQKELHLTDQQADAIRPIIQDYMLKREAIVKEVEGQGIIDHVALQTTLNRLKDLEYQKLSKILTPEQMQKYIDKENLLASLNKGGTDVSVDQGSGMGLDGASMSF